MTAPADQGASGTSEAEAAQANGDPAAQSAQGDGSVTAASTPEKVEELPEWAQKLIRDARKDAADSRGARKSAETAAQQQLAAVAKALGLADDEATPEKLQAQLAERDSQVAQRDELLADMLRERQAEKAARHHKADIDLLMPAISYNGLLDDLDPNDDDFADKVNKIVGEFVEKNPKYLAAASFPDLRQGNQGSGAAASNDPNAWLRQMAGRN